MNKKNIIFVIVTLTSITFIFYYFTAPFEPKIIRQDFIPKINNIAASDKNKTDITRNENVPSVLHSIPETNSAPAMPCLPIRDNYQIVSSTKSQTTIRYYSKPNVLNIKFLRIIVNDIPVEMIFDTGASYIGFNTNTINNLGIRSFLRSAISQTPAGPTTSYIFRMPSIKIGQIELNNIECAYIPTSADNFLGGSFLSNFIYSINEEDQTITFIPRGEKIRYIDMGIQASQGEGWAEINGVKYIYRNGKFEKQ